MISEGAFRYSTEGDIPSMSVDDIWAHVRIMDPTTFWEMTYNISDLNKSKRNLVLRELHRENPILFQTMEGIIRAYQSAYFVAAETRTQLFATYHHYLTAKRSFQSLSGEEFESALLEEKAPPKKKKREKENIPPEEKEVEEIVQKTKKVVREAADNTLFYAAEPFSDGFPLPDYRHVVPKGQKAWAIERVKNYGYWDTIYHCNGPWQAEMLVQQFLDQMEYAIIMKKRRGTDIEVTGYKVLHGKVIP